MKKAIPVLLSCALALALAGCGEQSADMSSAAVNSISKIKNNFTAVDIVLDETHTGIPEGIEGFGRVTRVDFSGSSEEYFDLIEEYSAAHPALETEYTVTVGGMTLSNHVKELDISPNGTPLPIDELCAYAERLDEVEKITIGTAAPADVKALLDSFPDAEIDYSLELDGVVYTPDTTDMNLAQLSPEKAAQAAEVVSLLPKLSYINTVKENGRCEWSLDELELVRKAAPEGIRINAAFELFGIEVDKDTETLEFFREPLGDEAVEVLRKALNYLPGLTRLLLDDCDIEYALLDELRSEFPDAGIVWRVRFGVDSVLTDTQVIWSIYVTNENCSVLGYCHDVLYVDVGHTIPLTDISWTANMPKLEVLIIARTGVSDLTPLLNCPNLEYLEIFSSAVTDVSILANFKHLAHLNISNLPEVTDITALYGMTSLERLMIVLDYVPEEQEYEISQLLPNCQVIRDAVNPTDNGWRRDRLNNYVPRYALLREQIGYGHYESPKDLIPWNYVWDMGWTKETVFTRS